MFRALVSGLHCFSVSNSCLTLCAPLDRSTLGFPVLHHVLELAQTQVLWVGDAIQPSHPLFFSFSPQSFPASGSFPVSFLLAWGGQSIGASALASVLPMNIQGWFPLRLTGLILLPKALSRVFSALQFKSIILWCSAFYMVQLSHPYVTTGKTIALTRQTFVGKVMSLLFNMLSKFVIAFLPRSKHLLISCALVVLFYLFNPCKNYGLGIIFCGKDTLPGRQ